MIAQVNVKAYKPRRAHTLSRQRVASRSSFVLPVKELRAPVTIMAAVVLCATVAIGHIFSWQIGRVQAATSELKIQYSQQVNEHIRLKAEYVHLRSKARVEVVAAEKLGLYSPNRNQVHHM
ncbi:cell division protein FtsL [Desulfogranum japonicum]|uniref:cell division protein FtsL n=1 Tax=Desulfogranum japonicum TaxID=231447 RepID=UPI0003F88D96|nr:cell division protein FtsL [Desulfogranum japonicum]